LLKEKEAGIDLKGRVAVKSPYVLILEASVGTGHTRAAQAIVEALRQESPAIRAEAQDMLVHASEFYRRLYRSLYVSLARHVPIFLDWIYDLTDSMPSWLRRFLLSVDRKEFEGFMSDLALSPPDLVLCTHFLPLELLSDMKAKKRISTPVWGVVTDVHPHGIWVYPGIDRYIVPTLESGVILQGRKIEPSEILAQGLPIHPDFSCAGSPESLRKKWDLPRRFTVLVLSGGAGVGSLVPVLQSFLEFGSELTVLAIAGKNGRLQARCQKWARSHGKSDLEVRVLGYVQNIHEWMALSDVVVTKPGGLSVFEALALEKPLFLLPPRGGQERMNLEAVVNAGAGVAVGSLRATGSVVREVVRERGSLEKMSGNAKRFGSPHASRTLARMIAGTVGGAHEENALLDRKKEGLTR
jgi:processive 1,2-diacylglycerol beta-glucosyltransferase